MTKDEIIRMARNAGAEIDRELWIFFEHECLQFAAMIAAYEREVCAKVCEERAKGWAVYRDHYGHRDAANDCAAAIRRRG